MYGPGGADLCREGFSHATACCYCLEQAQVYDGVYCQVLEACDVMHHIKEVHQKVVKVNGFLGAFGIAWVRGGGGGNEIDNNKQALK
jgi:hypothetical protein